MPKIATELRPAAVKALAKKPGVHTIGGVVGLYLQTTASTANPPGPPTASWLLRRTLANGHRATIGLGSYSELGLAAAREKARVLVERIAVGGDPLADRKVERSAAQKAKLSALTFEEAADLYIKANEAGWENAKHAAQWRSTLDTYAHPLIGKMLVEDIDMGHVLLVLEAGNLWTTKNETASRLRGRIEKVIAFVDARTKRERQNPARWVNNLATQLAAPKSIKQVEHHAALALDAMPEFVARLHKQEGMGARAVEFVVYTAARSGEVRGARWDEIDLDAQVPMWIVPASRMKAGREHRVPLSAAAVRLLKSMPRVVDGEPGCELVFPAPRGGQLSDMTLSAVLKRMKVDATVHGMRSVFRDWAAERTNFPGEMAELALAHKVADKVEAAYRRGDQFDKRRKMMTAWASFCLTQRASSGNVVQMRKTTRAA